VFELLATVAGQILQDAGSEDPNKSKEAEQEAVKEKSQSDLDSQVTSLGSVRDFTSVDKPQSVGKPSSDGDDPTNLSTVEDVSVEGSNGVETVRYGARTPSREEERKAFVKDVSASEGNGALVHTNASSPEEQVNVVTTFVFWITETFGCLLVEFSLFRCPLPRVWLSM